MNNITASLAITEKIKPGRRGRPSCRQPQSDRQTNRQADRQADRQTGRQRGKIFMIFVDIIDERRPEIFISNEQLCWLGFWTEVRIESSASEAPCQHGHISLLINY